MAQYNSVYVEYYTTSREVADDLEAILGITGYTLYYRSHPYYCFTSQAVEAAGGIEALAPFGDFSGTTLYYSIQRPGWF